MFAVRYTRFGGPEVLELADAPEPHAGPGEVRIRVEAAGVSPVDRALRSGTSPAAGALALPHVPGVDAAGVVDEVGAGVTGVTAGDAVFGIVPLARLGGASAQFAVLAHWAAKPESWAWAQAGGAGTGVETATRALDRLATPSGGTLLVDGAAGGVGSVVVQLAVARGLRVLGTGRPDSHAFLAGLGAVPVTYGPGLDARVSGRVDRALDVAGKGSVPALIALTGTPEHVLTLADTSGRVAISTGELGGEPGGHHGLAATAALAGTGRFAVPLQDVVPFARAADAHVDRPRRGKTVLVPG
ncbi:NADP-dependent oxidoreductase [Cryptosporangium arvum]|uniref:NADP-dependent oxidoreductase n=1 Tax=Cryptosporangium arvum TaxID=80871 RepID=UPI0004B1AF06|nr:NADP-dependent oxidoreductase [Cryptosporangium arvum]